MNLKIIHILIIGLPSVFSLCDEVSIIQSYNLKRLIIIFVLQYPTNSRKLECFGLIDGDLPGALKDFSGHFERIVLHHNNITVLTTNTFDGISTNYLYIQSNNELVEIEPFSKSMIDQWASTTGLQFNDNTNLT